MNENYWGKYHQILCLKQYSHLIYCSCLGKMLSRIKTEKSKQIKNTFEGRNWKIFVILFPKGKKSDTLNQWRINFWLSSLLELDGWELGQNGKGVFHISYAVYASIARRTEGTKSKSKPKLGSKTASASTTNNSHVLAWAQKQGIKKTFGYIHIYMALALAVVVDSNLKSSQSNKGNAHF